MKTDKPDFSQVAADTNRRVQRLADFKAWLDAEFMRETFTNPDDLRGKVEAALRDWRDRHPAFRVGSEAAAPHYRDADPGKYLRDLREDCAYIDIRGLAVGQRKAHRFPIDELYVELGTTGGAGPGGLEPGTPGGEGRGTGEVPLQHALAQPRLVIIGDPGAGKTTFLRWLSWLLCRDLLQQTLQWLARSREDRPDRVGAERCLEVLRQLALAMHRHPEGRQVQVPRRWAAEQLARHLPEYFRAKGEGTAIQRAEAFLELPARPAHLLTLRRDPRPRPPRRGRLAPACSSSRDATVRAGITMKNFVPRTV